MQAGAATARCWRAVLVAGLVVGTAAADDPIVPLPAKAAEDLALLGDGVVGKALPAPPIEDIRVWASPGPGEWDYRIVAGDEDGEKVRTESYERLPDRNGHEIYARTLGVEFVEHLGVDPESGDFYTFVEDDVELGYTSRFTPAILWKGGTTAGATWKHDIKIEAYKTGEPDDVKYSGSMTSELRYVGAYEVTTPAGTFPAILLHAESDIEIGPADVTDSMYAFYAKGIGKIAEVEATRISALFIYHSKTKIAKVLESYPKRED